MAVPPESLANLRPKPWTSETAPKGRKNAGLSVNEWRNELVNWEPDEIESFIDSRRGPAAKQIAAREVLMAIAGDKDARRDVCDYTNGKPNQKSEVEQDTTVRIVVEHVDAGYPNQITEAPRGAIEGNI